jgi:hypothetical protein
MTHRSMSGPTRLHQIEGEGIAVAVIDVDHPQ